RSPKREDADPQSARAEALPSRCAPPGFAAGAPPVRVRRLCRRYLMWILIDAPAAGISRSNVSPDFLPAGYSAQVSFGSRFELVHILAPSIFQVPVNCPLASVNLPSGVKVRSKGM